jgi:hypothetical protein
MPLATLADFRALLPQFAGVADGTIQAWLDDTASKATAEFEPEQQRAHILWTAHDMSLAGIGPEGSASAFAKVTNISSGSLSFGLDKRKGAWGLTSFGDLLYPLFRAVRGGPLVTGTGAIPGDPFGVLHGSDA